MTAEQKIRAAFDAAYQEHSRSTNNFVVFKSGYLSLLNELEQSCVTHTKVKGEFEPLYRLPKGVTKP